MGRTFQGLLNNRSQAHEQRLDWFNAETGTVVEVDPQTMAIKATINVLSDEVYDEWIPALVPWVGPDGYGPAHPPAIGSEVVLFSTGNEGETIFYLSVYNRDFNVPPEFADGARGLKTETAYKLLADLMITIISQQRILIQAIQQADVQAPVVRLLGGDTEVVRCEPNQVGFLGAAPVARQALPADAINLPTNNALTNAIKELLIKFGFAQ